MRLPLLLPTPVLLLLREISQLLFLLLLVFLLLLLPLLPLLLLLLLPLLLLLLLLLLVRTAPPAFLPVGCKRAWANVVVVISRSSVYGAVLVVL